MPKSKKRINNGTYLAKALRLNVKEGRYHDEGSFYELPTAYPCAFIDRRGYIIVDSEAKLRQIASVLQKVNFRRPISRQLGYVVGVNFEDWPKIEQDYRMKIANFSKAKKLYDALTDNEKEELKRTVGHVE